MTKANHGVYVELDVLFDTRLGTLQQIHPELALKTLEGDYFTRSLDVFEHLPKDRFKFFYSNRDFDTLLNSYPTNAVNTIREMCLKLVGQKIGTPHNSGCKLSVNIAPYHITTEFAEKLINTLVKYTDGFVDVELINKTVNELTPSYCKNNFSALFMYDSSAWLDAHAKSGEFKTCKIPEVTLFIPSIYFGTTPTPEIIAEYKKKQMSPFREFEISCSPYISVNVIDTEVYCMDLALVNKALDDKEEPA